jgi:hypothetical protein
VTPTDDQRASAALLAWFLGSFLVASLFYAFVLTNHDYETEYLALGNLVVRGQLNLYQDEMTGQWVPLPFYFFGASQVIAGPSLLVARLLSIAAGLGVVSLTFALGVRWGGPVAGSAAVALFCSHGLVMGYYSTVHFSSLVALFHLLPIWVLFCTRWPGRDLTAMALVSALFLIKPHYWPTIPFALAFLLWRATSTRRRLALTGIALALPVLFFAWDPQHLKLLAFVPVLKSWVEPLGYSSWHALTEDPERYWASDYIDASKQALLGGRVADTARSFGFLLKRYLLWFLLLVALFGLTTWLRVRGGRVVRVTPPTGLWFVAALFGYLLAWQFVIVGAYIKQAFAYIGAIAPLLVLVLGWLFATVWENLPPSPVGRAAVAFGLCSIIIVSPWVHRSHDLPRRVSLATATVPALRKAADRIADLIPPTEENVFLLGDALPVHLAGRRSYLRQFHEHMMVFTSVKDQNRYRRSGLWGQSEIEAWLGREARYAIIEPSTLEYYRSRAPYRDAVARIETLIADNFRLMETVKGHSEGVLLVYKRSS